MSEPKAPEEIVIRRAETPADYRACQDAQRQAWGIADDSYIVPIATLVGAQLHGGMVLGAFRPDGSAVGLSFAFLGRLDGRFCLYSQLTGVIPAYQAHGLGGRLKETQREIAREEGIETILWAFDPLQAGNARFNLDKLGAIARHYHPDMYGPRTDALNLGTPTDRLIAEWPTDPARESRVDPEEWDRAPSWIRTSSESAEIDAVDEPITSPYSLLPIPPRITDMRSGDPERAGRWLRAVRQAFLAAFASGSVAVGFVRTGDGGGYYLLARTSA